jgi:methylase of polypeptide subunit release factors
MPSADDAVEVAEDRGGASGLGRRGTPHGPFRRFLRSFIHFFSYHLILARQSTRVTRAAGFRLTVRPTVFHPRYFISSECFAEFIGGLDLSSKHVVDIGTGSGILALAAARAGAENVTATDINPNAALTAAENARANGMGDRVTAVCTDLLSALAPRPLFDVILSSPPKHAGEPRNLADRGWHAGPNYRDIAALFDQSRERLKPGGRLYVMVSSDSDLDLFGALIDRAGFRARLVYEHSIFIESLIIYELVAARVVERYSFTMSSTGP